MFLYKEQYKDYAVAMGKNGCRPLSFGRLSSHLERYEIEDHQHKSAWIAGVDCGGVFLPSHVGYNSMRHLVELLSVLLDGDRQVCLAVKPNMGQMLQRCGWVYAGTVEVDYPTVQEKTVWVNHMDMVPDWRWGDDTDAD